MSATPALQIRRRRHGIFTVWPKSPAYRRRALPWSLVKASVVVDNKPGANSFIGARTAAKVRPDGNTVLITTDTTQAASEHLFKKRPHNPVKDFAPVTALGRGGQIMVVNPALPVKDVKEFIALAKCRPGKRSFGCGSSSSRVAGEMFKQLIGTYILNIRYKSNPPAVTDLLGGQIDMVITDMAKGMPQVKAGQLKALGVSTGQRSPLAWRADARRSRRRG